MPASFPYGSRVPITSSLAVLYVGLRCILVVIVSGVSRTRAAPGIHQDQGHEASLLQA